MKQSKIHSHIAGRHAKPFVAAADSDAYDNLDVLGIGGLDRISLDAAPVSPLGTASITPIAQNLQTWMPGFVATVTKAQKIDSILGVTVAGSWADEEVVQKVLEHTGEAQPYGDDTNIHLTSWNVNFERRSVIRFEDGFRVGRLEEARSSAIDIDSATEKRGAASMSLDIIRNKVGFYGYNDGAGRTYGLLNDPSLPNYVTVPNGASADNNWSTKTYEEKIADITSALSGLRNQSGDRIDPTSDSITMAMATSVRDTMAVTNGFGNSVNKWLSETYPNVRVESAPEFDGANGGENVIYYIADSVSDTSTDGGQTICQIVPSRFQVLGSDQHIKGYTEAFTNALAGVMCKRPYAVYRQSGV